MRTRSRLGLAAVAAAWSLAAVPARGDDLRAGSSVSPAAVYLGQPVRYTGYVVLPSGVPTLPRWLPPDTSEAITWGPLRASRTGPGQGRGDTLRVEATFQAFRLGMLDILGFAFVDSARSPGVVRRLPVVRLLVMPVIPMTDSTPELKPLRAPLKAPWWERVPWAWVVGIVLLAAAIVWWLRRPRRRPVALPVARPAPAVDPADTALKRLQALRARRLPEAGEFGQHALELTAILRRYLEATTPRLRPGFTTADLAGRLGDEGVPADELPVLLNLLRVWDRVKFARAPSTVEEARKWEDAVEAFLMRRRRQPPRQEAA